MAQAASLFNLTTRFKAAIDLINEIDETKFPLLLSRIIKRLDIKNEQIFTAAEETQLQELLKLSPGELTNIIEACTFIFEQSAYFTISTAVLGNQLVKSGLSAERVTIFQKVWQDEAEALISRLRNKTVAPVVLESVGWRLHLQMAQSNLSRIKQPRAIFQFAIRNAEAVETEQVIAEFTHEELQKFYTQLETIQDQLDTLS